MVTSFSKLTALCCLISITSALSSTVSNYEFNLQIDDDNSVSHSHLRLPLISKALNKIVLNTCPSVQPSTLDSFYAYLNRQLEEGGDPSLINPRPFIELYNNITFCSEYLENLIPQISSPLSTSDKHEAIELDSTSHPNIPPAAPITTAKSNPHPTTNRPVRIFTPMPHAPNFEPTFNRNDPKEISTVIDKIAHNTSVLTVRLVTNVMSSFQSLYKSAFGWWGRSKRDLSESPIKPIYYSKLFLPVLTNDKDSYQQSLGLSWKRKHAYFHMVKMLKSFVPIAVAGCPSNVEISERHLTMVCELMSSQVLQDLAHLEASGAYINVSEDLLEEVTRCVNKLPTKI